MSDDEIKQILLGFTGANMPALKAYLHIVETIEGRSTSLEELDRRVKEIREWLDAE